MSRARLYTRTFGSTRAANEPACPVTNDPCDISLNTPGPRCVTCSPGGINTNTTCPDEGRKRHLFKRMYNTVRVSSSEYLMNKGALSVGNPDGNARSVSETFVQAGTSQASDRARSSVVSRINIPSRGNSLRTTKTSLRPGALAPGGTGVDVKHNSYARYLARIKGSGLLKEQGNTNCSSVNSRAVVNNKPRKYNIVALSCKCPV